MYKGHDPDFKNGGENGLYSLCPRRGTMNSTKHAILITLNAINVKGNNHYCTPSPNKVIELLKRFHNVVIKRSWYFQCCNDLEQTGYLKREKRYIYPPGPEIRQLPSMWTFTIKGIEYLVANQVEGAAETLKRMIAWQNQNNGRWPQIKDILPQEPLTSREVAIRRCEEIIKNMENRQQKKPNIINGVRYG